MLVRWGFLFAVLATVSATKKAASWASKFDVPDGFRSYQPKRHSAVIDESYGVGGFLDEGVEIEQAFYPGQHVPTKKHKTHHVHHQHHASKKHHHHKPKHAVAFLQLAQVDPAMQEAEQDAQLAAQSESQQMQQKQQQQQQQQQRQQQQLRVARATDQAMRPHRHPKLGARDRQFDNVMPPKPKVEARPQSTPDSITVNKNAVSAVDAIGGDKDEPMSMGQFRDNIRELRRAIFQRPVGEQSVTEMVTDASRSGMITEFFPKVSLRAGLKPGLLPGLADTASSSAAILSSLTSDPNALSMTVKATSVAEKIPSVVTEIQRQLPVVFPDNPQLHPLHPTKVPVISAQQQLPQQDPTSAPTMLEVSTEHSNTQQAVPVLREDQLTDLKYLQGFGQGLEALLSVFHVPDQGLQKQGLEMASLLKHIGDTSAQLQDPTVTSSEHHHHHHHEHSVDED